MNQTTAQQTDLFKTKAFPWVALALLAGMGVFGTLLVFNYRTPVDIATVEVSRSFIVANPDNLYLYASFPDLGDDASVETNPSTGVITIRVKGTDQAFATNTLGSIAIGMKEEVATLRGRELAMRIREVGAIEEALRNLAEPAYEGSALRRPEMVAPSTFGMLLDYGAVESQPAESVAVNEWQWALFVGVMILLVGTGGIALWGALRKEPI